MENKFKYSNDNKRYHTWNYHLQRKFGGKVFKVALNGGFTCPNIDGKKGVGGCIYCSSSGSGDFAGDPSHNILTQFEEVKERMHKKWHEAKYIPYFQAHTNTYAPASVLRERFEPVLKQDNVVGISIATPAPVAKEFIRENYGYVDYKELARNPDPYKGKSLTYSGKVIQVIEGDTETQHRIAVNGDYDNVIYVAYPKNIVTSRILDDDYVTVYGTSLGLYSYQSTMGGKITVPALYLDRIELQQ